MSIRNWIGQAARLKDFEREVDFLNRQLEFAEDRAVDAEAKCRTLDARLDTEREKRDKFLYIFADKLAVKGGNYGTFEKSLTPQEPPKPPAPDEAMEMRITEGAKLQRDIDPDPQPLDYYEGIIRQDPDKYLPA